MIKVQLLKEWKKYKFLFVLIWYSVSATLFQMIQSKVFISDFRIFFDAIATFIQTIAGQIALTEKNVAQISDRISNPAVAGIIYWLIRILICGGCLVGVGILVTLISIAIALYFGDWIKTALTLNLLLLLLFVQLVQVTIRWYAKECYKVRGIKY